MAGDNLAAAHFLNILLVHDHHADRTTHQPPPAQHVPGTLGQTGNEACHADELQLCCVDFLGSVMYAVAVVLGSTESGAEGQEGLFRMCCGAARKQH